MKKTISALGIVLALTAISYPMLGDSRTLPAGLAMASLSNEDWNKAIANCVLDVNDHLLPGETIADRPRVSLSIYEAQVIVPVEDQKAKLRRDALCKYQPQSVASR